MTLVSTVLTLGHQSRNIFCAFSCILSDYISLFHEMDKFSVPRIVRYGVGRATKYRPYKIMSSSLVTSLMFFTDRLPFLITTLATTFMIHSRPITNYEYLRLPNSVFSPMNSVWHYVTPFTGKAPISLCLFIYELLIQSARIFGQMVLLAILNIALGALTIATKLLSYPNVAYSICSRNTLTRVHYYPTHSSHQSKSVFVSYISTNNNFDKSHQAKLEDSELRLSRKNDKYYELGFRENNLYFEGEIEDFNYKDDFILIPATANNLDFEAAKIYTAYKKVDRKVKPVSGTFPQEAMVRRTFPHNPLEGLTKISRNPPEFVPTSRLTEERVRQMNINSGNFLWSEEEKLFMQVLVANEMSLAFKETDRGTLREDYFSPYIMPTIPHTAWEERNIPIPPGIKDKVIDLLKHKMDAGVYEHCQSAYRSKWFCVLKKSGKLRIVHDLQALNAVSI